MKWYYGKILVKKRQKVAKREDKPEPGYRLNGTGVRLWERSCPFHWCTLVVLEGQLPDSFQPVWARMYTEINLCKPGDCHTSKG